MRYVIRHITSVVMMSEVPEESPVGHMFRGSPVTMLNLVPDSKDYRIDILNFGKGVRTKFHAHDSEQILIVTAGAGMVATEKEERVVTPGDIIFIPAGEKHWHGATKDSDLAHMSVYKAGSKITQLE